eukprot:SAG22_NODE_7737_length_713_cov_0.680782_1_plen_92_part_10
MRRLRLLLLTLLLLLSAPSHPQDCVNRYDTAYGAGSCDQYIDGNESLCPADFSRGAQFGGYCDLSCGYGFCPPYSQASRLCPSVYSSEWEAN